MIIKVVKRSEGSSYEKLGRYVLNAKKNEPILFTPTVEYVMDLNGDGDKVAWYRITNCESDTPAVAMAEVMATQSANKRAKSDKTYHLVVSLAPGEQLSQKQAEEVEDAVCAKLGFGEHQRISAVHQDTNIFHMHIAVSKVHPKTLRCVEPYYQYYTLGSLAKELEIKYGLVQTNRIGSQKKSFSKVSEMETHRHEISFVRFMHERLDGQLQNVLQNGKEWQDLHDLMTEFGAVIKPRGAGLVVASADGKFGIKASSLDKKLSYKSLTERFGEYQPSQSQVKQKTHYERGLQTSSGMNSLLWEYKKNWKENYQGRAKTLGELRAEHKEQRAKLKEWYHTRWESMKVNTALTAHGKRVAYNELSLEMKADFQKQRQLEQDQKKAVREKFPTQTWDEYLIKRAEDGHTEALGILRKRKHFRKQINETLLTIKSIEEAKDVIHVHFKPTVLRGGRVIYRAKDGGVVSDEAFAICVPSVTEASTLLALTLANERFAGKAVRVEGAEEFKQQIAKLSALEGLSISFADPVLENVRKRHVKVKQEREEAIKREIEEKQKQQQERTRAQEQERKREEAIKQEIEEKKQQQQQQAQEQQRDSGRGGFSLGR